MYLKFINLTYIQYNKLILGQNWQCKLQTRSDKMYTSS